MDRRDFIGRAFCACAAATGGIAGWNLLRYLTPPPASSSGPILAADRALVEASGHLVVPFRSAAAILVVDQGRIKAFDARCTHAGCIVAWKPADRKFACPCHGGIFDAAGARVAGPPPRPLTPLQVLVRGSKVYLSE